MAFNPDNIWDKEEFRKVIKSFVDDTEEVEIYLITKSTDAKFITDVMRDSVVTNMVMCTDNNNLVYYMDYYSIKLFLAEDYSEIAYVDTNADDTVGIHCGSIVDKYKSQMKYITMIQFWIEQFKREDGGKESC